MSDRELRLGDVIDDYCSRCRLVMNHGVVALVGSEVGRVRCNTCMSEHAFRHAKVPRKKKDSVSDLFQQVLSQIPSRPETSPSGGKSPKKSTRKPAGRGGTKR